MLSLASTEKCPTPIRKLSGFSIEDVSNAVKLMKSNGLINFESEIRRMLEKGIILRYYLTSGTVEASLDKDNDVEAAIKILSDPEKYQSILKG